MLGADDSLDVFGVHGVGGIVGALLTGVFNTPGAGRPGPGHRLGHRDGRLERHRRAGLDPVQGGAADDRLVGGGRRSIAYKIVDLTIGLRVTEEEEREGLDISSHGETAYSKSKRSCASDWGCLRAAPFLRASLAARDCRRPPGALESTLAAAEGGPSHGSAPDHLADRPDQRARAARAGVDAGHRALVPARMDGAHAAVLHLGGPAQRGLQAGAGGHQPVPGRLQQPDPRDAAAGGAGGDGGDREDLPRGEEPAADPRASHTATASTWPTCSG